MSAVFYMERPGVPYVLSGGLVTSRPVPSSSRPVPALFSGSQLAPLVGLPLHAREGRSFVVQGTGRCCIGGGDGRGS
jgi:hypothetical protein